MASLAAKSIWQIYYRETCPLQIAVRGLHWPPLIYLANLLSRNMSLADCCLTCLHLEAVVRGLYRPLMIYLANLLSRNVSLADCCLTCFYPKAGVHGLHWALAIRRCLTRHEAADHGLQIS